MPATPELESGNARTQVSVHPKWQDAVAEGLASDNFDHNFIMFGCGNKRISIAGEHGGLRIIRTALSKMICR